MNTIMKVLFWTAPLFFVVLFVYMMQSTKFERDFAIENVRFEKQFQQAWNNFTLPEKDNFLKFQEEEAKALIEQGKEASKNLVNLKKVMKSVAENADKETQNGTDKEKIKELKEIYK